MSETIKIIIADDHDCVTIGLETILRDDSRLEVLAIANDCEALLKLADELEPAVIIAEIDMPLTDGIEAICKINRKQPAISMIAYSRCREMYTIDKVIKSGVKGFVSKSSPARELLWAITTVTNGGNYYCTNTLDKINQLATAGPVFTKSQLAILPYICEGKCDKEIALHANLSPRTIEDHRAKMKQKISVTTNAGIVAYAIRHGLFITSIFNIIFTYMQEDLLLQGAVDAFLQI
jgi:two-component system nitrate/nitrite response regulator NarL